MDEKLSISDMITIAIFTVIMFIIVFAVGMIGYIPVLMVGLPVIEAIICGIPFMLFLTKVKKFGMITILSIIMGLIFFATGHTWMPIIFFTIFGLIADFIFKKGEYSSVKHAFISYATFCLAIMGNMIPFIIMRDYYRQHLLSSMGEEYTNFVMMYVQDWVMILLFIFTFIAGLIGAYIGRLILKKHFEKAGIV